MAASEHVDSVSTFTARGLAAPLIRVMFDRSFECPGNDRMGEWANKSARRANGRLPETSGRKWRIRAAQIRPKATRGRDESEAGAVSDVLSSSRLGGRPE